MNLALFSNPLTRALAAASLALLLSVLAIMIYGSAATAKTQQMLPGNADAFRFVDIDRFVGEQKPMKKGTTSLMKPAPIRFQATVKRYPEERLVSYMYTVLDFFPMDPRPKVNHRMFVTTPGGHIMPVYVEDSLVMPIKQWLDEEGDQVSFYGYHMYNYSKGPAIMLTGFGW